MKIFSGLLACGLALLPASAQSPEASRESLVRLSIDSVDLKVVGTDYASLEVRAHVVVSRTVNVTGIRFEGMKLGDIPFFLDPIRDRFQLTADTPSFLPPIPLTIYYRDLDSLESLEAAVGKGAVSINGHARVELDLNLLDRISLRQWVGQSDLPLHQTIPLQIPGGPVGKTAMVAAIRTADAAFTLAGTALNVLRREQTQLSADLISQYGPSIVVAKARYSLQMQNGRRVNLTASGLGFRISRNQFILTGELVEPWKYHADVQTLLELHEATLIEDSRDLLVWPADATGSTARKLSAGDVRLERLGGKTDHIIVPVGDKRLHMSLGRRNSSENVAVLSFTNEEDQRSGMQLAPGDVRGHANWDELAVFRVDNSGKLSVFFVGARRERDRLLLDNPVDESLFGSPLIAPGGVIGMIQEERSALPVSR